MFCIHIEIFKVLAINTHILLQKTHKMNKISDFYDPIYLANVKTALFYFYTHWLYIFTVSYKLI